MNLREVGAFFLVLLTACSGIPRVAHPQVDADPQEAQLAAARYELRVLSPDTAPHEPVVVSKQDFRRAMRMLAAEIPHSAQPMETARWLMEGELHTDLWAETEGNRVVRLVPGGQLDARAAGLDSSADAVEPDGGVGRAGACGGQGHLLRAD